MNEKVIKHAVERVIAEDESGVTLVLLMDKYALYIAYKSDGSGKALVKKNGELIRKRERTTACISLLCS